MIGLWSAVLALPLTVQLQQAAVEITVGGTGARVQAVYTFDPRRTGVPTDPEAKAAASDSAAARSDALLHLSAIRYPDVSLELESASTTAGRIVATPLAGLQRLEVLDVPSELTGLRVELQYRLNGDLSRIPLFVPSIPSAADTQIEIRIRGVDPDIPVQAGFPRLAWESPGVLVARPDHLPAFVQLPPAGQRITTTAIVDAAIILLIIVGSLYWASWRRAAQRRHGATQAAAPE